MKRVVATAFYLLIFYWGSAQFTLKDFTTLLDLNQAKLETHLKKKGFKKEYSLNNTLSFARFNEKDSQIISRYFEKNTNKNNPDFVYKTTSHEEYLNLEKELKLNGFRFPVTKENSEEIIFFQKQNLGFKCEIEKPDTSIFYKVTACKKIIPNPRDLFFAEDLLQLNTHEYLAATFGYQNVKADSFYFSKTLSKKCTVIFPNTSRQAIFIWNDEVNLKDISLLIIGEQLNNEDKDLNAVLLSNWRSKQGIYCGMSLREMQALNKEPISFYNWRTESAGLLAPKNKGEINFANLKPVFNCMNCGFLYVDKSQNIIRSNYSIDENQKVYVASFVVLPEKQ